MVGGGFLVEGASRWESMELGLGIEGSLNSSIVGFVGLSLGSTHSYLGLY